MYICTWVFVNFICVFNICIQVDSREFGHLTVEEKQGLFEGAKPQVRLRIHIRIYSSCCVCFPVRNVVFLGFRGLLSHTQPFGNQNASVVYTNKQNCIRDIRNSKCLDYNFIILNYKLLFLISDSRFRNTESGKMISEYRSRTP